MATDDPIVDCSTISISYQVNGLANISMSIFYGKDKGPPYTEDGPGFELVVGGVRFKGFVTSQNLVPASDVRLNAWNVSAIAIGCRDTGNLTAC